MIYLLWAMIECRCPDYKFENNIITSLQYTSLLTLTSPIGILPLLSVQQELPPSSSPKHVIRQEVERFGECS